MFRFLGFVTGAALTIGTLVMVLGPPELRDDLQTAAVDVATPIAEGVQSDEFQTALGETLDEIVVTAKRLPEALIPTPPPVGIDGKDSNAVAATNRSTGAMANQGMTQVAAAEGVPVVITTDTTSEGEATTNASARQHGTTEPVENGVDQPPAPDVVPSMPATKLAEAAIPPESLNGSSAPSAAAPDPNWQSIWNPFRSQIAANGFAARLAAVTDIDYRVVRLKPGGYQVAFAYTDDGERAAKLAQIQSATGLDLPEAVP